ncbi:hypothetical protein Tco_0973065, partial [Tanacetum coccineum]
DEEDVSLMTMKMVNSEGTHGTLADEKMLLAERKLPEMECVVCASLICERRKKARQRLKVDRLKTGIDTRSDGRDQGGRVRAESQRARSPRRETLRYVVVDGL